MFACLICCLHLFLRQGRYEVDGYVYSSEEEPKVMMTGKWNESMSCQPCDLEGEPLPGTELKEVCIESLLLPLSLSVSGPLVIKLNWGAR